MVFHMKTTLVIDDQIMSRLKQEAVRRNTTISQLVEAALRSFLRKPPREQALRHLRRRLEVGAGRALAAEPVVDAEPIVVRPGEILPRRRAGVRDGREQIDRAGQERFGVGVPVRVGVQVAEPARRDGRPTRGAVGRGAAPSPQDVGVPALGDLLGGGDGRRPVLDRAHGGADPG